MMLYIFYYFFFLKIPITESLKFQEKKLGLDVFTEPMSYRFISLRIWGPKLLNANGGNFNVKF